MALFDESQPEAPAPSQGTLRAHHELVTGFAAAGLKLCKTLTAMLDEQPEHRTERRGCGYTQATRFLSQLICQADASEALEHALFDSTVSAVGQTALLRQLAAASGPLLASLTREESLLLAKLILSIALRDGMGRYVAPASTSKLPIGTCPLAEEYFLEIAYGRIRRGGHVHLYCDDDGMPLLLEKCQLGEKHSSISLAPLVINQVAVPVGSLIGLERPSIEAGSYPPTRNHRGFILPKQLLTHICFLRLTTLSVSPAARPRAFSAHFEQQVRGGLFSPGDTTMGQLIAFAHSEIPAHD